MLLNYYFFITYITRVPFDVWINNLQAGFLASLVERDDAVTSCCSSLRAISAISPALQLATGHCFILPDPPSNLNDLTSNYR